MQPDTIAAVTCPVIADLARQHPSAGFEPAIRADETARYCPLLVGRTKCCPKGVIAPRVVRVSRQLRLVG